eukprot:TRINITY_DN67748_c6_g1_i2.p1 TRINITY_DN67748_c6_g1~~TRINITY_DN67748_c6_g1_i2.p1  ORF type:complete len:578 (-),score=66.36 TRINITY_DN67748_c6_g1_i2:1704-3245(-)
MSVAYLSWLIDKGNKRGRLDIGGRPGSKAWDSTSWWDSTGTYSFDSEGCEFSKTDTFDTYDASYTNALRFVGNLQYNTWNNKVYDTFVGRVLETSGDYYDSLEFYEPTSGLWRGGAYLGVGGYGDLWWLDNVNASVPAASNWNLPAACVQAKINAASLAEDEQQGEEEQRSITDAEIPARPNRMSRSRRQTVRSKFLPQSNNGLLQGNVANLAALINNVEEPSSSSELEDRETMETQDGVNKISLEADPNISFPPAFVMTGTGSVNPTMVTCKNLPKGYDFPCTWTVTQAYSKKKTSLSYIYNFNLDGKKWMYHEIDNSAGSFFGNGTWCRYSASYQSFYTSMDYGFLSKVTYPTGGRPTNLYVGLWDDTSLENSKKTSNRYGSFIFIDTKTNVPYVTLEAIPDVKIGGVIETMFTAPKVGPAADSNFALSPACVARQKKGCDATAAASCLTKVLAGGVLATTEDGASGKCLFTAQVANCHANEMCLTGAQRVCNTAGSCDIRLCSVLKSKGN